MPSRPRQPFSSRACSQAKSTNHLRTASGDALLVSVADKLHNARAILCDYRELGEGLWVVVTVQCAERRLEYQLWFYDAMVETLRQTLTPKTLVDELSRVVGELKRLAK
jgi:hypothetical protein